MRLQADDSSPCFRSILAGSGESCCQHVAAGWSGPFKACWLWSGINDILGIARLIQYSRLCSIPEEMQIHDSRTWWTLILHPVQVSLSSLNRHAVATREDVGLPKAKVLKVVSLLFLQRLQLFGAHPKCESGCFDRACTVHSFDAGLAAQNCRPDLTPSCLQRHFNGIVPEAEVEAHVAMFTEDTEEELLEGKPDYVLDAIDDINTKVRHSHSKKQIWCFCNSLDDIEKMTCSTTLCAWERLFPCWKLEIFRELFSLPWVWEVHWQGPLSTDSSAGGLQKTRPASHLCLWSR